MSSSSNVLKQLNVRSKDYLFWAVKKRSNYQTLPFQSNTKFKWHKSKTKKETFLKTYNHKFKPALVTSQEKAQCTLLIHYYSVDCPWWFDRNFCRIRRKHFFRQITKCGHEFLSFNEFFFGIIILQRPKSSNQSRGQTHGWICLKIESNTKL